jgi:hypothetical protein
MVSKADILAQIRDKRTELQALKDSLQAEKKASSKDEKKEVKEVISSVNSLIWETRKIEVKNSKIGDLVKFVKNLFKKGVAETVAEEAVKVTMSVVGEFVEKYLGKGLEKELVNMTFTPPRLIWGVLSVGVTFGVSLKVRLDGTATPDIVTIKGAMKGNAYTIGDITLGASFTIPIIKYKVDVTLVGGIKGNLDANANVSLSLQGDGTNLIGKLSQTTIDTTFDITVFVRIGEDIVKLWNKASGMSFGYVPEIKNEITQPVGKWDLFRIILPGYDATFNMKNAQFEGKVNGSFSVVQGKQVKDLTDKIISYMPWTSQK